MEVERPLVDALVSDAAAQSGGLPLLSAMLVELWRARDGRTLRYASYRATDLPILITATGGLSGLGEHASKQVQTITSSLVWRFNWH